MIQQAAEASQAEDNSTLKTAMGVVLMLFGATTVFAQLQDSFNKIWGVRAKPSKRGWLILLVHRLISLAMVLTIGFLLLVSLILSTMLSAMLERFGSGVLSSSGLMQAVDLMVGLVVITLLFALLFKVMPDVRLHWRDVGIGAVVTAILFTIGRRLIALYLGHSTVASIYGTAGSLVALLIWVYYSCAILFYGVEFTRVYHEARGLKVLPRETAVQVREEIIPNEGGTGPPRVDLT
jgi:membrane protein